MRSGSRLLMAIATALVVVPAVSAKAAVTDVAVLSSPSVEIYPSASATELGWSQNSNAHPRFFNAFIRPLGGGKTVQVNAPGTRGFAGGFDGSRFIFQQISKKAQSDLRIYDTSSRHYVAVPNGVNTSRWERAPSMDGDYLVFNRDTYLRERTTYRVVLHQISTGKEVILDSITSKGQAAYVYTGQLTGDYVTWERCTKTNGCDVYIYRISTGKTTKVPDRRQEYSPAVSSDGTVYFIRSAVGCGAHVELMRDVAGTVTLIHRFAKDRDSFATYAIDATHVLHDVENCRTGGSDVYEATVA